MSARDDHRFMEDAAVAFAMYCDENRLDYEDGLVLAEETYDSLLRAAESRANYLPPELLPTETPLRDR